MGKLITRAALPAMRSKLALAAALAWLLTGCASALPMVADKVAHITQLVIAKEPLGATGNELINRAGKAAAQGRYAEAESYLDAALSVDPYDHQALRQLAVIYRLTGRPQKARRYEELAREVDIADAGAWTVVEDEPAISDEANTIERFTALGLILDVGLISSLEYDERREANLGALLPLTQPSPALNPGRAPPRTGDVIERLRTINRFNRIGALDDYAYALERNIILEGLMPLPKSGQRTIAAVVPQALDPEAHQIKIDRLFEAKLISPREYNMEIAVLVGLYSPAAGVMDDADSAPVAHLSMMDRPWMAPEADMTPNEAVTESADDSQGAATLDQSPALAPVPNSVTRINIHLALARTPESAKRSWDDLQQVNGLTLDGLIPRVSRVDLGGGRGVFFQLSAGPLADMAAAEALCDELLSRDYYCAPLVF